MGNEEERDAGQSPAQLDGGEVNDSPIRVGTEAFGDCSLALALACGYPEAGKRTLAGVSGEGTASGSAMRRGRFQL